METQELNELLRKLKPVLGERQAQEYWELYHADLEIRQELETELRLLARQHLGISFAEGAIVLEPIPQEAAAGEFALGTVLFADRPKWPFGLRSPDMIQHVGLFGRAGSGKTNVVSRLLLEHLRKGKPFLVLDWKRNFRDLLGLPEAVGLQVYTIGRDAAPFAFNPLLPPAGAAAEAYVGRVADILGRAYNLGEGAAYLIQKAIGGMGQATTLGAVKGWLEAYDARGREGQWRATALRVLSSVCRGGFGRAIGATSNRHLEDMLRRPVVLELDALDASEKVFFIESLLMWIHQFRLSEPIREVHKHTIVLEEAHNLLRRGAGGGTVLEKVIREIRELGEALVIVDQHPSLMPVPAFNQFTTIGLNLKHESDVSAMSGVMGGVERNCFLRLRTGEGIVRIQDRWSKPFLVRFDHVPIRKGSVTDDDLRRRSVGFSAISEESRPPIARASDPPDSPPALSNVEEEALWRDISAFLWCGLAERFGRLGFSWARGERLKKDLVARGLLQEIPVRLATGRLKLVLPTEQGRRLMEGLGLSPPAFANNAGPEHEYWKHRVAENLRRAGWKTSCEVPLSNGQVVDVLALRGGERLAVEIETGKSRRVKDAGAVLAGGVNRVLIVCTSAQAARKLKDAFVGDERIRLMPVKEIDQLCEGGDRDGT